MLRRTASGFSAAFAPAIQHDPDVGAIMVPNMRRSVVLPAPFGPRSPKISPLPISKVASRTASTFLPRGPW